MNEHCNILLAAYRKSVLRGLLRILNRPEFEIVSTVQDGHSLVRAAGELNPDIILADISVPLPDGVEAVRQIRKNNPNAKIILLSMRAEAIHAVEAMRVGASGYLVMDVDSEELITAVRIVRAGGSYVTPSLRKPVMTTVRTWRRDANEIHDGLTEQERAVLRLFWKEQRKCMCTSASAPKLPQFDVERGMKASVAYAVEVFGHRADRLREFHDSRQELEEATSALVAQVTVETYGLWGGLRHEDRVVFKPVCLRNVERTLLKERFDWLLEFSRMTAQQGRGTEPKGVEPANGGTRETTQ